MGVRTRVVRLERETAGRAKETALSPVVFVRLPDNGRGPPYPGEYPSRNGRVVTVIYESVVGTADDHRDLVGG